MNDIRILINTFLSLPDDKKYYPRSYLPIIKIFERSFSRFKATEDIAESINFLDRRLKTENALLTIKIKEQTEIVMLLQKYTENIVPILQKNLNNDINKLFDMSDIINKFKSVLTGLATTIRELTIVENDVPEDGKSLDGIESYLQGWFREPTVGWLTDSEMYLDLMNYENINNCTNSQEYIDIVRHLWTMLTFFWGTATFYPKCSTKLQSSFEGDDSKACGCPLLFPVKSLIRTCSVRTRKNGREMICDNNAILECRHGHNHDSICQTCLDMRVEMLCSNKHQWERSTDIYDASVSGSNTHLENIIFHFKNLKSRKPPKVDVNWKTSYRLQQGKLVAIVLLPDRDWKLEKSMRIYWGEIVNKDKINPQLESKRRKEGEISVRILSRADSQLFPSDLLIPFKRDSHVALIDLRVFVPEVISVLSALSDNYFEKWFQESQFQDQILGRNPDIPFLKNFVDICFEEYAPFKAIEISIRYAINKSSVSCIKELTPEEKERLINSILNLSIVKTLDHTQCIAFCSGLYYPSHCTQGPPGTGKSYVGVCLVSAYTIIRDFHIRKGKSLGPIVTLSYKNHALDEFLVDILHNNKHLKRKDLIRLGRPENEELKLFIEQSSKYEDEVQKQLDVILNIIKNAKSNIDNIVSGHVEDYMAMSYDSISLSLSIIKAYIFHQLITVRPNYLNRLNNDYDEGKSDERNSLELSEILFESLKFILDKSKREVLYPLNLMNEAKHIKIMHQKDHQEILFRNWINCELLPPRCVYPNCLECASLENAFCELHQCRKESCKNSIREDNCLYCHEHNCHQLHCQHPTIFGINFCLEHACPICMVNSKDNCKDHKCSFKDCRMPIITEDLNFCSLHCCSFCWEDNTISSESIRYFSKDKSKLSIMCDNHRCKFSGCVEEDSCRKYLESQFCDVHTCALCNDCIDPNCQQSSLCRKHRCNYAEEECCQERITLKDGRRSEFCLTHTCKMCIISDKSLTNQVFGPNNTCILHPPCQWVEDNGDQCPSIANTDGGIYCMFHYSKTIRTCHGIKKKDKARCRAPKPENYNGIWYCDAHRDQKTDNQLEFEFPGALIQDNIDELLLNDIEPIRTPLNQFNGNYILVFNCCFDQQCENLCFEPHQICFPHKFSTDSNLKYRRKKELEEKSADRINTKPEEPLPVEKEKSKRKVKTIFQSNEKNEYEIVYGPDLEVNEMGGINRDNLDEMEIPENYSAVLPGEEQEQGIDEPEEDTLNDQQLHYQEIYGEKEEDDELSMYENEFDDINETIELTSNRWIELLNEINEEWSWKMSGKNRHEKLYKIIKIASNLIKQLCFKSEVYIDSKRKERAVANAESLKKATIVGGTVVGAIKRLPALRAAEPFAIIVEEACEVMEPTLMSVLAITSIQKIELIGDHRQLQACIDPNWFDIECFLPSLKISLFERLVNLGDKDICSILDVQRRMQHSIADITRPDYVDVVDVTDHDCTQTQKIGDRVVRAKGQNYKLLEQYQNSWGLEGRAIPGLQSNVFFWDLMNNTQSRPKAGLSACNENEANAVVQLIGYLLLCGVNPNCITVITPYQGQKREIIASLRKEPWFPKSSKRVESQRDIEDSIVVSTVDRYQGDENDIIILSLVRTKPGNRFISLQNRFIVATSRARLGFFVVGSTSALCTNNNGKENGPKHWLRFLGLLRNGQNNSHDSYDLPRVGHDLPICCPVHRINTSNISSNKDKRKFPTSETWSTELCQEICPGTLKCGHICKLPCHAFNIQKHREKCEVELPRECSIHSHYPILCHELDRSKPFLCKIREKFELLDCDHDEEMYCYEYADENTLNRKSIECSVIVDDFIRPDCGHRIPKPKCCEWRKYSTQLPKCEIKVDYRRPCGHTKSMSCNNARKEINEPTDCKQKVTKPRPRCGHDISLECCAFSKLNSIWDHYASDSYYYKAGCDPTTKTLVIKELNLGNYGPCESTLVADLKKCEVSVDFQLSCGHLVRKMSCHQAYNQGSKPIKCTESITDGCKLCQEKIKVPCSERKDYDDWNPFVSLFMSKNETTLEANEAQFSNFQTSPNWKKFILKQACGSNIIVNRECGHKITLTCQELLKVLLNESKLPSCASKISRLLSCGHRIEVPCKKRNIMPEPACKYPIEQIFRFPDCEHTISTKTCEEFTSLKCKFENGELTCKVNLNYDIHRCRHKIVIQCSEREAIEKSIDKFGERAPFLLNSEEESLILKVGENYCQPCLASNRCQEKVSVRLSCNHLLPAQMCYQAFQIANLETKLPDCVTTVEFVSPLCEHNVRILCRKKVDLDGWAPWLHPSGNERKPRRILRASTNDRIDSLIRYPLPESQPVARDYIVDTKDYYRCDEIVTIVFEGCNHTKNIHCDQLYRPIGNKILTCQEQVTDFVCPGKCCAKRNITCSDLTNLSEEEIAAKCPNYREEICSVCKINTQRILCPVRLVQCNNAKVTCKLPCGHEATWICGQNDDPRLFHDSDTGFNSKCFLCVDQSWKKYLKLDETMTNETFMVILRNMIEKEISDFGAIDSFIPVTNSIDNFFDARSAIINNYVNAMKLGRCELTLPNYPASMSQKDFNECLIQNFDSIFLEIPSKNTPDPEKIQQRFKNYNPTNYGKGLSVKMIKLQVLSSMAEGDQVRFLAGISFRLKCLEASPPFVLTQSEEDKARAHRIFVDHKNKGFDCVNYYDGQNKDFSDRIYWFPGSCLPLAIVALKLNNQCCICQEFFPKTGESGVICDENHFVCNECFSQYLESAKAPDAIHSSIDKDGLLTCPFPNCRKPYDILKLACHHCSEVVCRSIADLQYSFKMKKEEQTIREEEKQLREKELERIMKLSIQERDIELAKFEIIEKFLNPQCPRCHKAFIDFNGCFALTCGDKHCNAAFCAWCLRDCGNDAHTHVASCPNSITPGNVFGDVNLLNRAWNVIRKRDIENFLQIKSKDVKEGVKKILKKEFQDLGLTIN